jgi:hypothetical protein
VLKCLPQGEHTNNKSGGSKRGKDEFVMISAFVVNMKKAIRIEIKKCE